MAKIAALFARFGVFGQKDQGPDAFDMRLTRIGTREQRCAGRSGNLFKNRLSHQASAVLS